MTNFSIFDFFTLLCGIALFLYGMQQGEKNLKKLGRARLRQIIAAFTKHRLTAYSTGFLTTIITQSSSATTVMLVGLASVQLITLRQSLGVILGSDLGTTVTVGLFALKFYLIAPLLIAIGYTCTLVKKPGLALAGKLIFAIGLVFFGMHLMADASSSLRTLPGVMKIIEASFANPLIGICAGTLITVLIHSSAATLTIIIAMAHSFSFADGSSPGPAHLLPLVLGANIGTCSTAFIALVQAEIEGVRVAWAHLSFKVLGTIMALPFIWLIPLMHLHTDLSVAVQIAALHTVFNLYLAVLFLPLIPLFDKGIRTIVGTKREKQVCCQAQYLSDNVLEIPTLAIAQTTKEISRMADIVLEMARQSQDLIKKYDFSAIARINKRDDEVDSLHGQIMTFLTRIGKEELGSEESLRIHELTLITADIEHIGDILSKNMTSLAEKIDRSPTQLSPEGKQELIDFFDIAQRQLSDIFAAFADNNPEAARAAFERKATIKEQYSSLMEHHVNRLYRGKTQSLQTTAIHIDLLEEVQRINFFAFRLAASIQKMNGPAPQ